MAKTDKLKVDSLNRGILHELQQNARVPVSEIGRRVGLSAPAVSERITKLEEEGVITGYAAKIDWEKTGLPIQAFITFRAVNISHRDFIKFVSRQPEVLECYIVTGSPGAFMKVATDSTKSLGELIERFKAYGETNTSIILSKPVDGRFIKT